MTFKRKQNTNRVKLPKGVNEKEKAMFLAFVKSVQNSLSI